MKTYACVDLKSFYASVECRERGLEPLDTNLVVADETRTSGTICLAVTPSLKEYGISGRARLFEVKEAVKEINGRRLAALKEAKTGVKVDWKPEFTGKSTSAAALAEHPDWRLDFIIAPPRMRLYMKYSAEIYRIYLRILSAEDILVYSIDEVFLDLTEYIKLYQMSAEELVAKIIKAVHAETGITATAGIGPNMYLAKVAMDITAKHMEPNELGARIATLDERSYREKLWGHEPLTDFWRIGRGYERKLRAHGIRTMGDVARVSLDNEELLFRLFGVNAELLIDHAWGYEPTTMAAAKNYRPASRSISEGQVLPGPYDAKKARLVLMEMSDEIALHLVRKHLVSSQFVLMIGYSRGADFGENFAQSGGHARASESRRHAWARGTVNIPHRTSSTRTIMRELVALYDRLVEPRWMIRKLTVTANEVVDENTPPAPRREQLDLFGEFQAKLAAEEAAVAAEKRERNAQQAMLAIKQRYGKNAILRAMDFEEGATARKRNGEVGGHRA